ncbi:MFS transporter [Amycolatopsis sp. 195334CR]|uniref:MFS transporter n=1 Tax=Amycolatopsis sp. 195334CR TaxID=2814588 RepID=UPI001A8D591C|nr:MFS transporter [Amycolatopsis sp. 195334CR]MBN6034794.1 MFS transporter [Amycolatopsis sp. 195334CR]
MPTQVEPHLRNEWSLLVFTATTNLADAVTKVALPLLAASLTRSPTLVALVATMLSLPWLLTALHVGVLVDRLNRRSLMFAAELARLAAIGVAFFAYLTGTTSLPLIFGVAGVLGVAEVVALTAGASIIPAAVAPLRRHKATARITAVEYLCNGFLGAPVGGFLVAAGAGLALGVTGLVYAAGALLLLVLIGNFEAKPVERRSVHLEIRDGLNFLWQHRVLRTMALLVAVMAGAWNAWLAILPLYAVAPGPLGFDARGYGLLLTALGAGGVLGALLVGPVNRLIGRRWAMFADLVGSFLLVAVPAVWPNAWAVGAAAFAAGVGGTMWTVNARLLGQELVPDHLLGRFNAAYRLVSWGAAPVAAALAGVLTEFAGFGVAFGFFAVLGALTIIPFFRVMTAEAVK